MKKIKTQQEILIADILPNPEQPRKHFDEHELAELADSIREHGVIKPIAVEEAVSPAGKTMYILHDGERRWRASKIAELETIPAVIMPALNGSGPYERLVRALVANIQHAPMSPVDDALAIARLRDEHKMSNREISKKIGKAEAWISTRMRLAELDPEIQQLMREKKLSTEDKAVRALLTIANKAQRIQIAAALAERKASANMVEHACREFVKLYKAISPKRRYTSVKQAQAASTQAMDQMEEIRGKHLPEWDALYQLGRVPPFPILNDVVMRTCDNCSLRPMASPAVCGQCALVCALSDMLATIAVEAVIHA